MSSRPQNDILATQSDQLADAEAGLNGYQQQSAISAA
jgi:hypothetical protein